MKNTIHLMAAFFGLIYLVSASVSAEQTDSNEQAASVAELEQGKNLAFTRSKGNCLACHYVQGGTLMGNTGPGLIAMKQRFPEREKLVAQITDARTNNKNTFMPPFGAHGILTEQEIQLVVNWLYTL